MDRYVGPLFFKQNFQFCYTINFNVKNIIDL